MGHENSPLTGSPSGCWSTAPTFKTTAPQPPADGLPRQVPREDGQAGARGERMAGPGPGLWRAWADGQPATRAPGHLGEPGLVVRKSHSQQTRLLTARGGLASPTDGCWLEDSGWHLLKTYYAPAAHFNDGFDYFYFHSPVRKLPLAPVKRRGH